MSETNSEVGVGKSEVSAERSVASGSFVPFFSDPARAAQFRAICKTWEGTPFRELRESADAIKGPGGACDCLAFPEQTFFEMGATPRFEFPRSAGDYKRHVHNDKILRFLRGQMPLVGRDSVEPQIDPQSARLAQTFTELTNLDELVPVAKWPKRTVNTGLITGDIAIIKSKLNGVWHLAVMQDDRTFMHCAWPGGVTEADITQAEYRDRLEAVFRLRLLPCHSERSETESRNPADDLTADLS